MKKIFSKQNILKKTVPNWVRNLCYIVMLLETVTVVVIYHAPDLFIKIVMKLI